MAPWNSHRMWRSESSERSGFVMISIVFVLLALLVLCAPFLTTARNANKASQQTADEAQRRLALDAAEVHARYVLQGSHPGNPDETPYWDDLDELDVRAAFPEEFLNAQDPTGVMWDLSVDDVAGKIDLNSASPFVMANLLDMTTRLSDVLDGEMTEIAVPRAPGFEPAGYLWIRGELVKYDQVNDDGFTGIDRGVGTYQDDDDQWQTEGPRPPSAHGIGTHVMDQRAFAPSVWRLTGAGEPRRFDSFEQLIDADKFALAGTIGVGARMTLSDTCSVHADVRAGDIWQKPVRLVSGIEGGETLSIAVDDPRYINPGSTIQITDGEFTELRLVQGLSRQGRIRLENVLENDYHPWRTIVRVQRRSPVNINTAKEPVLIALFENLQLRGRNDRITRREAESLAELVSQSRPFTGLKDFMERVVLPSSNLDELPDDAPIPDALGSSGGGFLQAADGVALYLNALNANDAYLEFSTMPFCFTSRDVYEMDLRAAVNAKSGKLRTQGSRERTALVVPQRELFSMWATQEDFDEAMRLSRRGAFWATGPEPTTRYDGSAIPPSRAWPHLGTLPSGPYLPGFHDEVLSDDGESRAPVRTFATRDVEESSYAQLWAARVVESGRRRGRMLHFDHETYDPEGRVLSEQRIFRAPDHQQVGWADGGQAGLMKAMAFDLWVKPTGQDEVLLDVAGSSQDVDRLTLAVEGEDLVLRVIDGMGDHRGSTFVEQTETRFAIGRGTESPGLPADTWSHISIDMEGSRPDQVDMMVNGMAFGVRRLGMSRLATAASQGDGGLTVEDTEGFPGRGVARVGNELIEYVLDGNTLTSIHQEVGSSAGFGGRIARERWTFDGIPVNLGAITTNHPAGAMVSVYGYSIPFATNVPGGGGTRTLGSEVGTFKVARAIATDDTPYSVAFNGFVFGNGFDQQAVVGLELVLADDSQGEVMDAFHQGGGYAVLCQRPWLPDPDTDPSLLPPLGGFEIVRYSGYSGNILNIVARGETVATELPRYGGIDPTGPGGGSRQFVTQWTASNINGPLQENMRFHLYVVPISLDVPGATAIDFIEPAPNRSEFVQITRVADAEMTEWVRYDTIQEQYGHLVRDHPSALEQLLVDLVTTVDPADDLTGVDVPGQGGPPGGGPGGPPKVGALAAPNADLASGKSQPVAGPAWDPYLGVAEMDDYPLSRSIASRLQFRGVMETHIHAQTAGLPVVPVLKMADRGVDGGRPGMHDEVFLVGEDIGHLGWPMTVHRSYMPSGEHQVHTWDHTPGELTAIAGASSAEPDNGYQTHWQFVALTEGIPEPFLVENTGGGNNVTDPRMRARMVKWPSGERPRVVGGVAIGGDVRNGTGLTDAVVDEVMFDSPDFLTGLPGANPATHTQAASMILREDMDESTTFLDVAPTTFITPDGYAGGGNGILGQLPADAGILRIGDELVAYDERDAGNGELTLTIDGRGLLGTSPGPHQRSQPVAFLEHYVVTTLASGISGDDSMIPLEEGGDFPTRGLVLIGDELIHYTRRIGNQLDMPRGSNTPGAMDERGPGLFRGRFGTTPMDHPAGSTVILFPFRYWDLWADQADAPELAYMGFEIDQPGTWWMDTFWHAEGSGHGGSDVQVLVRTDPSVPWDSDPDDVHGLMLMTQGTENDEPIGLDTMSDRMEWRVFARYRAGAFDPLSGLSHGWKETPRLRALGASYMAPTLTLRSVDR